MADFKSMHEVELGTFPRDLVGYANRILLDIRDNWRVEGVLVLVKAETGERLCLSNVSPEATLETLRIMASLDTKTTDFGSLDRPPETH